MSSQDLSENGFKRTTYLCQYRHKRGCYISFSIKEYSDRIVLLQSSITLNGSEGSMNLLAESISLVKLLERHNDPADTYHMD